MTGKVLLVGINAKYAHTALAVRSLVTYVRSKGDYNIAFMEATINDNYFHLLEEILSHNAEYIGFSCYIWNGELIEKLMADLNSIRSEVKLFLGGPEVTYDPEAFLRFPHASFIIRGEGERPLLSLLQGEKEVPGVWYQGEETDLAPLLTLDEIPFVYTPEELAGLKNRAVYYETSRGCPFRCAFCISSLSGGVRTLSLERVFKEIDLFIQSGVKKVKLVDRTFNFDQNRAAKILRYILEQSKETCFHFEIGGDLLNEELIQLLCSAKENQIQLEAGIQSTHEETLLLVDRKTNMDKLTHNVKQLRGSKARLHLDLIAGLPEEDYKRFQQSVNEAFLMRPDILQLGFLKLLHGSKLRAQKEQYGYRFRNSPPYEVLETHVLSFEELMMLKRVEEAVDVYYNSRLFTRSINYLLFDCEKEPFAFFEGLGQEMGTLPRSFPDKCKLLLTYCKKNYPEMAIEFSERLKYDYVVKQRGPLPDYFVNYKTKELFQAFSRLLEEEDIREAYFGGGVSKGRASKEIDIEVFRFSEEFTILAFDRKNNLDIDLSDKIVYHRKVDKK